LVEINHAGDLSLQSGGEGLGCNLDATVLQADWAKGINYCGAGLLGQEHHVRPVDTFKLRRATMES